MAKKKTDINQDGQAPENTAAATAAGEVESTGTAPTDGDGDTGAGNHPNPERAASDAAEAAAEAEAKAATEAAAKTAAKEDKNASKATAGKVPAAVKESPLAKFVKEGYAKQYPKNKTFHVTSDKQVFLDKDKNLAELHQRSLKEGKVTTVNVD